MPSSAPNGEQGQASGEAEFYAARAYPLLGRLTHTRHARVAAHERAWLDWQV